MNVRIGIDDAVTVDIVTPSERSSRTMQFERRSYERHPDATGGSPLRQTIATRPRGRGRRLPVGRDERHEILAEQLADLVARQLLHQRDPGRNLVRRHPRPAPRSASASISAPGSATTNAQGTSPSRSSGTPATAASATPGCSREVFLHLVGEHLQPAAVHQRSPGRRSTRSRRRRSTRDRPCVASRLRSHGHRARPRRSDDIDLERTSELFAAKRTSMPTCGRADRAELRLAELLPVGGRPADHLAASSVCP